MRSNTGRGKNTKQCRLWRTSRVVGRHRPVTDSETSERAKPLRARKTVTPEREISTEPKGTMPLNTTGLALLFGRPVTNSDNRDLDGTFVNEFLTQYHCYLPGGVEQGLFKTVSTETRRGATGLVAALPRVLHHCGMQCLAQSGDSKRIRACA